MLFKLLIFLSFFIFTLSASSQDVNPNKGKIADTSLPVIGKLSFSLKDLKKMRMDYLNLLFARGNLSNDIIVQEYLHSLGEKIAVTASYQGNRDFFVSAEGQINAGAGIDGIMVFYRGLIGLADNEGELASVMSHELAHVTQRHIYRFYTEAKTFDPYTISALIAVGLLGGDIAGAAISVAGIVGSIGNKKLSYSRGYENEADAKGVQYLAAAGYDPKYMLLFFQKMKTSIASNRVEFFQTHPLTTNRINNIKNLSDKADASKPSHSWDVRKDNLDYLLFQQRLNIENTEAHTEVRFAKISKQNKNILQCNELFIKNTKQELIENKAANFKANSLSQSCGKLAEKSKNLYFKLAYLKFLWTNHLSKQRILKQKFKQLFLLYPSSASLAHYYVSFLTFTNELPNLTLGINFLEKNIDKFSMNKYWLYDALENAYFYKSKILSQKSALDLEISIKSTLTTAYKSFVSGNIRRAQSVLANFEEKDLQKYKSYLYLKKQFVFFK